MPPSGQPQATSEKSALNGQGIAPAGFQSAQHSGNFSEWEAPTSAISPMAKIGKSMKSVFCSGYCIICGWTLTGGTWSDWLGRGFLGRGGRELDRFRGKYFWLRGRAVKVDKVALPASLADRLGFSHYFRVRLEVEGGRSSDAAEAATGKRPGPVAGAGLFAGSSPCR